jgi:hypothetical protein
MDSGSEIRGALDALAPDVAELGRSIDSGGPRAALAFLNRRTPHRFTGVFRFDGDLLRNLELIDKWDPAVSRCDDVPVEQAYCAHLQRTGEPLDVADGRADARVPWMRDSPIVSYCGVVIEDEDGRPWGALCHFDVEPCEAKRSDLPLLLIAAGLLGRACA